MGFSLSIILSYDARIYTSISVDIPPSSMMKSISNVLNGPIIVPTLQTYLTTNSILYNATNSNSNLNIIIQQTSIGQKFGNLFAKGSIHFAPKGLLLTKLLDHLHNTTPILSSYTVYIHDNENNGMKYILSHLDERALVFIILREISLKKVNYVIRMNYTTLPSTNRLINDFPLGLDTDYQKYFLSGFLSIQSAVDDWVLQYLDSLKPINTAPQIPACSNIAHMYPNNIVFVPFPTYAYNQNPFYTSVGFLLGLAMTSIYRLYICHSV